MANDAQASSDNGESDKEVKQAQLRTEAIEVAKKELEKDYVPKTQFLSALKSAGEKTDTLQTEVDALKLKSASVEKPQRFTRAQLRAGVEAGQLTQEQADETWDDQLREDIRKETATTVTESVSSSARSDRVNTDMNRYIAVEPEVLVEGSQIRSKVQAEFTYLTTELGDPNELATQLKAMRAALGPIEALELAKSGTALRDTHKEAGGGEGVDDKSQKKEFKDTLTDRERNHYQRGVDSGLYKDWGAVEAEMKHANPATRKT